MDTWSFRWRTWPSRAGCSARSWNGFGGYGCRKRCRDDGGGCRNRAKCWANGDDPSLTGKTRLSQPADAGFNALRRFSQRLRMAEIRLLTRKGPVESHTSLAAVVSERSPGKCRMKVTLYKTIHFCVVGEHLTPRSRHDGIVSPRQDDAPGVPVVVD